MSERNSQGPLPEEEGLWSEREERMKEGGGEGKVSLFSMNEDEVVKNNK